MDKPRGMLEIEELEQKIEIDQIDTVVVAFTDHYERVLGKRFDARHFIDEGLEHGTHGCDYLLTVDMEMEPVPGYEYANWESGYGDFHMVPDLTMGVNAKGVFLGCKYGIPAFRRAGGGSIINTASFVALLGAATPQIAYTASKGAVLAMTRELAVVHARENIRVDALCPGPLKTELLVRFLDTEEKQRRLVHVPMGRFGEAAEMAKAALCLASDESSYVPGPSLWSTVGSRPHT
jgi:NAD(P)-dependent dehydrogenase (short-subunit alcohol dehydrogenase family)